MLKDHKKFIIKYKSHSIIHSDILNNSLRLFERNLIIKKWRTEVRHFNNVFRVCVIYFTITFSVLIEPSLITFLTMVTPF